MKTQHLPPPLPPPKKYLGVLLKTALLYLVLTIPSLAQSWHPNGPEIYTCIFGFDDQKGLYGRGVRIKMESIGNYWINNNYPSFDNFIEINPNDPNYSLYSNPIYPITATDNEPSHWLNKDYDYEDEEKRWYGFEIHWENNLTELPDFAYGIYKISVDLLYDPGNSFYQIAELGYIYLDCRDSQLGNYTNTNGHHIDIAIKFTLPTLNQGRPTGEYGTFEIKSVGNSNFYKIQNGETVRYWELKDVDGPTEISSFAYSLFEVPQNIRLNGKLNDSPTILWNTVSLADSYYVFRAFDDNGLTEFSLIGKTANNSWVDNSVTISRISNIIFYYKIAAQLPVSMNAIDPLSPLSSSVGTRGTGPIFKSNKKKEENKNEIAFSCYPNPFNPTTTLTITSNKTVKAKLNLYNIEGKLIKKLFDGILLSGTNKFSLNLKDISSGIYYARLISDNFSRTLRIAYEK